MKIVVILLVLIVILGAIVYLADGGQEGEPFERVAEAPAENPGLLGVSEEYRQGIEEARNAPAQE